MREYISLGSFLKISLPKTMKSKCACLCVLTRLKFTVVSEPMDDDEECVDVGHAFLDLQELLLTGNDVLEQQIDSKCCICIVFAKVKVKTIDCVLIWKTMFDAS